MTAESDWAAERQRFIDANTDTAAGTNVPAADPAGLQASGHEADSLLGGQFVSLARELFAAEDGPAAIDHIVAIAVQVVPGAELASLTQRDEQGQFHTPAQTDGLAATLDKLQYTYGEGPCVSATLAGGTGTITSPDLGSASEWPSWGPAAAEQGVRSVLAVGLFPDGEPPRLGAINCYATQPHGLSTADTNVALLLAAHAATALSARHAVEAAQQESAELREALQTRDVIGQAKGILMHRQGLTAGQAFDQLRHASQSLNIKLRELAETVTTRFDQL